MRLDAMSSPSNNSPVTVIAEPAEMNHQTVDCRPESHSGTLSTQAQRTILSRYTGTQCE